MPLPEKRGREVRSRPYLSIVVTTRNDNHGGDLLRRTQIFLDGLAAQSNRHSVDVELVIVEWNPPTDRAPLADVLRWPDGGRHFAARIITVPEFMHRRLANSARLPLFQMIAKNVGIRRARGDFVLATNIDVLFSDRLMSFLSSVSLDPHRLYRLDRYDAATAVPAEASVQEQLAWCEQNLVRICRRGGTLDLRSGAYYRIYEHTRVPLWFAPWIRLSRQAWYLTRQVARRALGGVRRLCWLIWRAARRLCWLAWRVARRGFLISRRGLRVAYPRLRRHVPPAARKALLGLAGILLAPLRGLSKLDQFLSGLGRLPASVRTRGPGQSFRHALEVAGDLGSRLILKPISTVFRLLAFEWPHTSRRAPSVRRRRIGFRLRPKLIAEGRAVLASAFSTVRLVFVDERARMRLHTNACGDFTLVSRAGWFKAGGYPELELFSMHIDSLFLYQAYYAGIHERFIPYRAYHIEHDEGFKPDPRSLDRLNSRLEQAAIPQISNEQFLEWIVEMYRSRRPKFRNLENWGLANELLDETMVVTSSAQPEQSFADHGSELTVR
jgi:hypothetical protein